jgi:hypothetical protein
VIEAAFYTIALTAAAWAVWVRRKCWTISWERPTSSAIAQLALSLVLIAPATEPYTGRLLFELTGRWHLNDLLGFMFALGSLVSSNLAGMMRMPTMRQYIAPLLWTPLLIGTTVEMGLFLRSPAANNPSPDFLQLPHHPWLTAFFAFHMILSGYYCGINAWCARVHLRAGDPNSRPVAMSWLICIGLGAGCLVGWLIPALGLIRFFDYGRLAMCGCVTVYAVASARSWQRKLHPYRKLIRATGARL